MPNNKKAQSLPMNTVIIAILILVVLVVIIAYFLGGFGQVGQRISEIFNPHSAYSASEARQVCAQHCEALSELDPQTDASLLKNSRFCKVSLTVDNDGDGKADRSNSGVIKKYYCNDNALAAVLSDRVGRFAGGAGSDEVGNLGVSCPYTTC